MDRCAPWLRLLLTALVRGAQSALPPTRDRTCLRVDGAIAPENRSYATLDGQQTPLGIVRLDWASATIENWLYRIIVEEVLGINAAFTDTFPTSVPGLYAVTGCKDPMNHITDPKCREPGPIVNHVLLGLWEDYARLALQNIRDNYPEMYPHSYGAFDYVGRDSVFAPESALELGVAEEHLPLEYYKSYSHPSIDPSRFFSSPWNINGSRLKPCASTKMVNSERMGIYLKFSQDRDGVVIKKLKDGKKTYSAKCYRDSWWLSPACRGEPEKCIPFITGADGWHLQVMMQKAAAWDMPIAIAVASTFAGWGSIPQEHTVLFYWWFPDTTFLRVAPVELRWPAHNTLEWRVQNRRTDTADIRIAKWAYHGLRSRSNTGFAKPLAVLEKMTLMKEDLLELMNKFVDLGSTEAAAEQLACEWLSNNTERWQKAWIPLETACLFGQGMVNASGSFVSVRSEAKECRWCATGRKSVSLTDADGATHICQECSPGFFQEQKGETACLACPLGTSADRTGAEVCDACAVGTYAARKQQDRCTACAAGFVTEFPGAVSEAACICAKGSYRDGVTRACVQCKRGMECPVGSDEMAYDPKHGLPTAPELVPGYWSSADDPLSVYACENELRCTGGPPGDACMGRLVGQACAHCEEGWRWNGDECTRCRGKVLTALLFPVLPLIGGPVGIVLLYTLSTDSYPTWGSWRNGIHAAVFIILNHYQILAVARGTNIVFPGRVGSIFDGFLVTTDVMSYFNARCAGIGSFQSLLILQSLTPALISLMYLLVWLASRPFARNLKMDINRTLNGFFSLMFTFFAGIASTAFTIFKCGPNPNGTSSLIADRSVVCYAGEWKGMVVIGIFAVLFWCVGFGAIFCRSIYRAPVDFHDEKMQMRWKFLFKRYRPDVHWWALVFLAKGIAMNLGFLFMNTGLGQLWWILYVLTAYAGLVCAFRPWRHMAVNIVDLYAHLCLVLATAALTSFAHPEDRGLADRGMSRMIVVLVASVAVPAVYAVLHMIWRQKSAVAIARKEAEIELIANAYEVFAKASSLERYGFLDSLSEWDFWYLLSSSNIVHQELAKRRSRPGYSIHCLQGPVGSASSEYVDRWAYPTSPQSDPGGRPGPRYLPASSSRSAAYQ